MSIAIRRGERNRVVMACPNEDLALATFERRVVLAHFKWIVTQHRPLRQVAGRNRPAKLAASHDRLDGARYRTRSRESKRRRIVASKSAL
jgi:hypothetical protein